jgi:hypothetical protein
MNPAKKTEAPMVAATRARSAAKKQQILRAIKELSDRGIRLSYAEVSRATGVSRTTLYADAEVRKLIMSGKRESRTPRRRTDPRTTAGMIDDLLAVLAAQSRGGHQLPVAELIVSYCHDHMECRTARHLVKAYRNALQALNRKAVNGDHRIIATIDVCFEVEHHGGDIVDNEDTALVMKLLELQS